MLLKSYLFLLTMQDDLAAPVEGAEEHADAAHAAMEHSEVIDVANWLPALTALLVFGIAFIILWLKVWPLIVKGLDERERKIRDTLAEADAAKDAAEAAQAKNEELLVAVRAEANEMKAQAKADAKAMGEELHRKKEAELADLKLRSTRDIESAKQAAITQIHAEATMLAAAIASKILQREISAEDQQGLVDEALGELGNLRKS